MKVIKRIQGHNRKKTQGMGGWRCAASEGHGGGKAGDHWRLICGVLKPRFLPEIKPAEWNYVVDIHGAWAAGRYRFIKRYRSGMADNAGEEFDAPFARINHIGPDQN